MKALFAAAVAIVVALTGCSGPSGGTITERVDSFDGGVLRVRYPTEGNQDIFIFVNRDGSVADVAGGATDVSNFRLSRSALEFSTEAVTSLGTQPMRFALGAVAEGSWVGEYTVGGSCAQNCVRTGAASWEKGGDQVTLQDS